MGSVSLGGGEDETMRVKIMWAKRRERTMNIRRIVVGAVFAACLSLTAAAYAQNPTGATYGPGGVAGVEDDVAGDVAGEVVASGSLPFTGLDLVVALGVALLLLAIGISARRLARERS